jgi:hypothetical protein
MNFRTSFLPYFLHISGCCFVSQFVMKHISTQQLWNDILNLFICFSFKMGNSGGQISCAASNIDLVQAFNVEHMEKKAKGLDFYTATPTQRFMANIDLQVSRLLMGTTH